MLKMGQLKWGFWFSMNSKRAVIGAFTVNFVATIIIILILVVYALLGVFYKTFDSSATKGVDNKYDSVDVKSYDGYFDNFIKLAKARAYFQEGKNFEESLVAVGYEE